MTEDDYQRDDDGWAFLIGSRFATPEECAGKGDDAGEVTGSGMVIPTVFEAFVRAADNQGRIVNHSPVTLYEVHISAVLRDQEDESVRTLQYDSFVGMALMEATFQLVGAGYLAHRGNGDSVSYRLTLPVG